MSGGVDKVELHSRVRVAMDRFAKELGEKLGEPVFWAKSGQGEKRHLCARVGPVVVELGFKIIRASNGEASGWVTARLTYLEGLVKAGSVFTSPPWLGGATAENVANSIKAYIETEPQFAAQSDAPRQSSEAGLPYPPGRRV